eukprot:5853663-Amphidinium_carterae.1
MKLLEGPVAKWKKNAKGVWRPRTAVCLGVAFVVPDKLQMRLVDPIMAEAEVLKDSGRLIIAEAMTHARSILVVNVYLHSGVAGQKQRADAIDVVLADWNESYFDTAAEFPLSSVASISYRGATPLALPPMFLAMLSHALIGWLLAASPCKCPHQ